MAGSAGGAAARRGEDGAVTLWVLGLAVVLLFVGGLSLDLWRAFSERRALAGVVDAAAVAGASGVDQASLRDGSVLLDPARAEARARALLARQTDTTALTGVSVSASTEAVTVTGTGRVELTLLRVLLPDRPLTVEVTATGEPRGGGP